MSNVTSVNGFSSEVKGQQFADASTGRLGKNKVSSWEKLKTWTHKNKKALAIAALVIGIAATLTGVGLVLGAVLGASALVSASTATGMSITGVSVKVTTAFTLAGKMLAAGAAMFVAGIGLSAGSGGFLLGNSVAKA